jgi:hypothetical protein
MAAIRYGVGEGYSAVDADVERLLVDLPSSPVEICRVAQGLVVLPNLADGFGITGDRLDELSIRTASDILRVLARHDGRGVELERPFPPASLAHAATLPCWLARFCDIAKYRRGVVQGSPRTSAPGCTLTTGWCNTATRLRNVGSGSIPKSSDSTSSPHHTISAKANFLPAARRGRCAEEGLQILRSLVWTASRTTSGSVRSEAT